MAEIKIPQRMRKLPRYNDYIVPYTTWVHPLTHVPDFKINDEAKRLKVILEGRCAMCGQYFNKKIAFIGGPEGIENHALFVDAGMHPACAAYAWEVCPYIVYGKGHATYLKDHSDVGHVEVLREIPTGAPDRIGMVITSGYTTAMNGDHLVVRATEPWESVVWRQFKH